MSYDCKLCKDISPQYKKYVKEQYLNGESLSTYCIVDIEENDEVVKELKIETTPYFVIY